MSMRPSDDRALRPSITVMVPTTTPTTVHVHRGTEPLMASSFHAFESPARDADELRPTGLDENHRFVAGEQLYNQEMYGSLRKGPSVTFFSMDCLGLVVAVFTSALSYQALQSVTRPYMGSQLALTQAENRAVERLVNMPMALSFFVGMISDCYPILGMRRKSYMVLGLLLNGVSILTLAALSLHFESLATQSRNGALVVVAIVMISLASFGCIITFLCVQTRVLELAQREPLRVRGHLLAEYTIFRRVTTLIGALYVFATMGSDGSGHHPRVAFSTAMFLLAAICVLPLPGIMLFWREPKFSVPTSLALRGQIYWKIMQQKAVWRVLMFISFFSFFLAIHFSDSVRVVAQWAGAAQDNALLLQVLEDCVVIVTVLLWRVFFVNTHWRRFYCWAPIMLTAPALLATLLTVFDAMRDRYVYRCLMALVEVSTGVVTLHQIVPLTEIIQEGSEGGVVGLTLTLHRVISMFVSTNAQGLFRGDNFFDLDDVAQDTTHARWAVLWSVVANYGINLLALVGLFFLPRQKLDTQQLRMYGGFTKGASSVIVAFVVALFGYSVAINVMTFVPSFSCLRLVGGEGCS